MLNRNYRGLLGTKLGMTQVWDANNRVVPVTVIQAGPNVVTQVKTTDNDGYSAVQLGFGEIDPRRINKPLRGHFETSGVTPRRHLVELRTADAGNYRAGQELTGELFDAGQVVDVTGTSKGKGFAGVMKRHGFKGLGAGHGVERKHRSPGSVGGCATPGRVFKGLRMAGRMGHARVTVAGLTIHAVDTERGFLLIKGAVPGPDGGLVFVRSAAKRPAPEPLAPVAEGATAGTAEEASA
ncbi:50S ribosomal protein L3 [Parafrankia sp. EUN1f]|uniref:50S ribosomal protein L3 n=1 Tax=Parafrankia sp. EUN1f TaxID=102897 RepID=UPI0001C44256|nr:50S ribosomal protein L3 [Parafrankia sp. EUN1f]EFC85629.1 ribosomal protein L3 [Parafrankia sp. EUN1f]